MKKNFIIVLTATIALVLNGCYYDNPPFVEPPSNVSFANDIQPIFNQNCIICHNSSFVPDLTTGNSFNALMNLPAGSIIQGDANGSELFQMLNGGGDNPMPPGSSIPQSQIDTFGQWINEGAKNN